MRLLKEVFHLFYPKICVVCEQQLLANENILCTFCRHDLPIIPATNYRKNRITAFFYGRIPIEKGISFLFFRKKGKVKDLIHQLKYKGNQKIGLFLGDWFGEILKENEEFNEIDYIVPVPLHPKKLKQRGYNQVTKFGQRISKILKIPYKSDVLIRTLFNETQTSKNRFQRFKNADATFLLTDTLCFEKKHVLLIDDVITTGATLEGCCNELLKTKNIKISILSMAFTE